MKLVLIAHGEGISSEVMELLEKVGADSYTRWTGVQGKGKASGPHLGTHVWPKLNAVVAVALEDTQAERLVEGVRELRQRIGAEGVKAFVLPLEAIT